MSRCLCPGRVAFPRRALTHHRVSLSTAAMQALMRRAVAYEKMEDLEHLELALGDLRRVLELEAGNRAASKKLAELEAAAEAKREQVKKEMLGEWLHPSMGQPSTSLCIAMWHSPACLPAPPHRHAEGVRQHHSGQVRAVSGQLQG